MGSTATLAGAIMIAVLLIGLAYYEPYKHRRWKRVSRRNHKSAAREAVQARKSGALQR
jgi:hypothetical protein